MDKFQHKLRTTLHTRSVESIMTRTHAFLSKTKDYKLSHPKFDNISTYLRKFQIDRQNLNLAKRIMQCESQHNRNRYIKEWKKTKKFLKVRSNFKPHFTAQEPRIYRYEEIPGHGRLVVNIELAQIVSYMKQLSSQSLYMLKFAVGGTQLIPNKAFLSFETAKGYSCLFRAPHFLKNKPIVAKMVKVVQNNLFDSGKLSFDLSRPGEQKCQILSKTGKAIGHIVLKVEVESRQRTSRNDDEKQNAVYRGGVLQRQSLTDSV